MTERDELKDYMEGSAYGGGGDSVGGAMGRAQYYENLEKQRRSIPRDPGDVAVFLVSAACTYFVITELHKSGTSGGAATTIGFFSFFAIGWFLKSTRIGRMLMRVIALAVVLVGGYILFHLYADAA